jgi:hypothetical protein
MMPVARGSDCRVLHAASLHALIQDLGDGIRVRLPSIQPGVGLGRVVLRFEREGL